MYACTFAFTKNEVDGRETFIRDFKSFQLFFSLLLWAINDAKGKKNCCRLYAFHCEIKTSCFTNGTVFFYHNCFDWSSLIKGKCLLHSWWKEKFNRERYIGKNKNQFFSSMDQNTTWNKCIDFFLLSSIL